MPPMHTTIISDFQVSGLRNEILQQQLYKDLLHLSISVLSRAVQFETHNHLNPKPLSISAERILEETRQEA